MWLTGMVLLITNILSTLDMSMGEFNIDQQLKIGEIVLFEQLL